MGYCCVPYRIDFKRLRDLRGSRDQALFDRLRALAIEMRIGDEDEDDDDYDEDEDHWDDDDDGDGDPFQAAGVINNPWLGPVASILNGEPMPADAGKDYRFAVDLMCTLSGPQVALWSFKGGVDHLEAVQAALRARGLHDRVSLQRLLVTGFPLPAPANPDPRPEVGYMTAEEVAQARGLLRAQSWGDVSADVHKTISEIDQAIEGAAQCGAGFGLMGKVVLLSDGDGSMSATAIDLQRLKSLPGSRNDAFLERVRFFVQRLGEWTPEINMMDDATFLAWKREQDAARAEDAKEDGRSEPPIVRAARSLLFGKRLNPNLSVWYGELLSLICHLHGAMLDNHAVAPADPRHFTDVNEALEARGLLERVDMLQLVFGGPPIKLPVLDDSPSIGHMTPEAVKAAQGLIATRDWSIAPREVRETVLLVDSWITEAAAHGEGLVCFYS